MADTRLQQLEKTNRNPVEETEYQNLLKQQGATSTTGTVGTPSLTDFFNQYRSGLAQTQKTATGAENEFLNRYRGAIAGQEALPAMASRLSTELGIPQLQGTSTKLNTLLQNMPYTQQAATRGFDVNQNQLDRLIAQKASELAPTATAEANKLVSAQNLLGQQLGYGQAQQQRELLPFQTEASMMSDRIAREVTGYTNLMQSELTSLLQQIQNGITLSENAKARAQELAMAETNFENQKTLASTKATASTDRYITVGSSLYDTQTGQWLKAPMVGGGTNIETYLRRENQAPSYFVPESSYQA